MLYTSAAWILAAVSVINILGLVEFNNLSAVKVRDRWLDLLGILAGALLPPVFYLYGKGWCLPLLLGAVFVFFLKGMAGGQDLKDAAVQIAFKALGLIYVALPLSYLAPLRDARDGQWWMLFLLVVIWANDTFAFFVGKAAGKHRLAPSISPKKTVEGAVAGIFGGMGVAVLLDVYLALGASVESVLALSFAVGVIGMIGDLSESLLKRSAGVKDSGAIIPGHGGVLDRVDSLLFPIPLIYYFLIW